MFTTSETGIFVSSPMTIHLEQSEVECVMGLLEETVGDLYGYDLANKDQLKMASESSDSRLLGYVRAYKQIIECYQNTPVRIN